MKLDIVNASKQTVGSIDLNDALFGGRVKQDLIWASVVRQNAGERRGTHASKNRALVSGSGKKPYAQKGTGQARHGPASVVQFRGGGRAFGPVVRSHEIGLPKKVRAAGLKHALSSKAKDSKLIVVDEASVPEVKTKALAQRLAKLNAGKMLIVDGAFDEKFERSARNLADVVLVVEVVEALLHGLRHRDRGNEFFARGDHCDAVQRQHAVEQILSDHVDIV